MGGIESKQDIRTYDLVKNANKRLYGMAN